MNATWCEQCQALHLPEVQHVPPTGMVTIPTSRVSLVDYAVHAFRAATQRVTQAQAEESKAARDRVAALRALHDRAGLSYKDIGNLVGLSAARINQLLNARST